MEINELKEGMRVAYPADRGERTGTGILELINKAGDVVNGKPYVSCYVKFHTSRPSGQTHSWWPSNRLAKA